MSEEKEFRVIIPKEEYQIIEFKQDDFTGIGVTNLSLVEFEPKEVFSWHCSIMIDFENFIENGMPTNEDVLKAEKFEDYLDENISEDTDCDCDDICNCESDHKCNCGDNCKCHDKQGGLNE